MRGTVTVEPRPVWITSVTDGRDHSVRFECVDQAGVDGQLSGVCGAAVLPTPCVSPPGPRCALCDAAVQASNRPPVRRLDTERPARLQWIIRWIGRWIGRATR